MDNKNFYLCYCIHSGEKMTKERLDNLEQEREKKEYLINKYPHKMELALLNGIIFSNVLNGCNNDFLIFYNEMLDKYAGASVDLLKNVVEELTGFNLDDYLHASVNNTFI